MHAEPGAPNTVSPDMFLRFPVDRFRRRRGDGLCENGRMAQRRRLTGHDIGYLRLLGTETPEHPWTRGLEYPHWWLDRAAYGTDEPMGKVAAALRRLAIVCGLQTSGRSSLRLLDVDAARVLAEHLCVVPILTRESAVAAVAEFQAESVHNLVLGVRVGVDPRTFAFIGPTNVFCGIGRGGFGGSISIGKWGRVAEWDVSRVTDMRALFANCTTFDCDISGWDVSGVDTMAHMFTGASQFNQDIGNWDVKTTTNVWGMLHGANSFDQDISRWRVAQKLEMQAEGFFYGIVLRRRWVGSQ